MLKGLPLAYNRDLQEDKEPAFDTADHLAGSIEITQAEKAVTEIGKRQAVEGLAESFAGFHDPR